MTVIIPGIDAQNQRISIQPQNVSELMLRISGSVGEEGLGDRPYILREEGADGLQKVTCEAGRTLSNLRVSGRRD